MELVDNRIINFHGIMWQLIILITVKNVAVWTEALNFNPPS